MKAEKITMQIVKNLGNYETVRFEAEFLVEEGELLIDCFSIAKQELENSFNELYKKPKQPEAKQPEAKTERKELVFASPEFYRVCKALDDGKADLKYVQQYYILNKECIEYMTENKLIK